MEQVNEATRRSLRWCARRTQDVYWFRLNVPTFSAHCCSCCFCTEVLVVGGYKLVERGIDLRSLCVGVFKCLSVCLLRFHCMVSSCHHHWSRVPPTPFIVCKGRGWVIAFGCTKIERECPKVLPSPSHSLSSCIRTIIVVVVACRDCR
jgi:hypothetical protein